MRRILVSGLLRRRLSTAGRQVCTGGPNTTASVVVRAGGGACSSRNGTEPSKPSTTTSRVLLLFQDRPTNPRSFSSSTELRNKQSANKKPSKTTLAEAKTREINSRIVSLGKNHHDWRGILELYRVERDHFNDINFATSMSQLGRIRSLRKDDTRLEELMVDIATHIAQRNHSAAAGGSWEPRAIANVIHSVARMRLKSDGARQLINTIVDGGIDMRLFVENGNPQAIANTAWACANLEVRCTALFEAINEKAAYLVENGNGQSIANTAWACATLGIYCPALFKAIDQEASYLVENGTPQAIANTAWACATLGFQCPALFKAIDENALYLTRKGQPQEIANTAWACATLGFVSPTLFKAMDEHASLFLVENGTPQAIANTAWACATLGVECPTLFNAINNKALRIVASGSPQNIANTAWACATLGVECPAFFKAIDEHASFLLEYGNSQEIANTAWACATLGVLNPALFKAINDKASNLVENASSQAIVNTVWAYATLGVECPSLLDAINKKALYLVENGNPREIANTAWACAILGAPCPSLFKAIDSHMASILDSSSVQTITNLCYSFAILDLATDYESACRMLWDRAIKIDPNELSDEGHWQLLQAFVMLSSVIELPPPNGLKERTRSFQRYNNTESKSQREMSALLEELGFAHTAEASLFPDHPFLPKGLLAIDVASKEGMIAFEFDGPSHFLRDVTTGEALLGMENGSTKAKRRFLERLGWTVVNIRFSEWMEAKTEAAKMELLAEKLSSLSSLA